ncbi:MAG: hypothetical protein K2Y15_12835 [Burkholderiaceae bacterium]|jgi:hypothetical protein|uniref:hypothetical protein n=1 Tax=Hylemonella sp. TaxID=2066020 RepID=UPI0035B05A56|nr:hypothetical protein [Burkholderiaceae bacterium]
MQTTAPTPMASAAARRPWRHFQIWTLLVGLSLQLHLGYLFLVDYMNPAPEAAQLVQLPIEVLQVQDRTPHLQVRLVDHSQRSMEFPASAAFLAPTHTPLQDGEWNSLGGCMGYVLGVPVRWVRGEERFRIWELHCGPVHRVYEEFKAAYAQTLQGAQRSLEWHGGIILLLTLLVLVLERRAMWRRERQA